MSQLLSEKGSKRLKLEIELNSISYSNIPVGSILAYHLTLLFDKEVDFSKRPLLIRFKQYLIANYIGSFELNQTRDISNSHLFICSSDLNKNLDFFSSIKNQFDDLPYYFFFEKKNKKKSERNAISIKLNSLSIDFNFQASLIWQEISVIIKKHLEENDIDLKNLNYLKNVFLIQVKRLKLIKKVFQKNLPLSLLTDHDRQPLSLLCTEFLNNSNIPTFTLVHGSIYPLDSYVPLIANKCLCWGAKMKQDFLKFGIPESRLEVVGNSKYYKLNESRKISVKKTYKLDSNMKVALFASNLINDIDIIHDKLIEAFNKLPGWCLIIKLHPLDSRSFSDSQSNNVVFIQNEYQLNEIIEEIDLVIINNSNLALDALLLHCPVIIFNPTKIEGGFGKELAKFGNAPYFEDVINLNKFLSNYDLEDDKSIKWINDEIEYSRKICFSTGDGAAKRVKNLMLNNEVNTN